jgi:hypothetical protein
LFLFFASPSCRVRFHRCISDIEYILSSIRITITGDVYTPRSKPGDWAYDSDDEAEDAVELMLQQEIVPSDSIVPPNVLSNELQQDTAVSDSTSPST